MSGDPTGAVEFFDEAIDSGFRLIDMYDSAIFASMRDDEGYQATRLRLLDLIDAERASLGMPPYRPIAPSEEQEDRPSFVN